MKHNFISFSLLLSLLLCGCKLATTTRGEAHQEMYLFSYFNGNGPKGDCPWRTDAAA